VALLDARALNLGVSGVVAVAAAFFYFRQARPGKALAPAWMQAAFCYWWGDWILVTLVYLTLVVFGQKAPRAAILLALDTGSLLGIAFFFQYVLGDDLDRKARRLIGTALAVVWGVSFLAALLAGLADPDRIGACSLLQIALSELLGTVSVLLNGWAIFLRHRSDLLALFLLVATVLYALFQLPAYLEVFVAQARIDDILLALAFLKTLRALLFFYFFSAPFWRARGKEDVGRSDPGRIGRAELWPWGDLGRYRVLAYPSFRPPQPPLAVFDLFVAMPFAEEFRAVYEGPIAAVAGRLGRTFGRGDDIYDLGHVIDQVWSAILHARVVIADCTGRNPNVLYEVGIADTLGKPVVLLAQSAADLPFDVQHRRTILYSPGNMTYLEAVLEKTLRDLMGDASQDHPDAR
jgi:hypothetical protein